MNHEPVMISKTEPTQMPEIRSFIQDLQKVADEIGNARVELAQSLTPILPDESVAAPDPVPPRPCRAATTPLSRQLQGLYDVLEQHRDDLVELNNRVGT